jgi:DNA (cytosine-5)-methyltransferase 1
MGASGPPYSRTGNERVETEALVAHTLKGEGFDASEGEGQTPIVFDTTQVTSKTNRSNPKPGDPSHPLAAGAHPPTVAFQGALQQDQLVPPGAVSPPLAHSSNSHGGHHQPKLVDGMAVRRLTPIEAERLMGLPDGYTAIPWRGKPPEECPDGPRYRALGNSMACNVMRWIGERIQIVEDLTQ